MAGRGPAPKAQKRRRNSPKPSGGKTVAPGDAAQPDLPEGIAWPERTQQWWRNLGESPLFDGLYAADWDFLLDTAVIHAEVWGDYNFDRLSEIRIRMAKFGVTPEDRQRLKIEVEPPAEEDQDVANIDEFRRRLESRRTS